MAARDGNNGAGGRRATIRSISTETGLSLATVSRALKASPAVHPETARLVHSAAERLGYRRSALAANLRNGRSGVVSLVMPVVRPGDMLGDVGALQLMAGATARLAEDGGTLTLVPTAEGEEARAAVVGVIEQGLADGVILTLTEPQDERVKLLHARGVPFVTFGRTELALPHAFYDVDNVDFGFRATRLLLERGCRRPVLVEPPGPALFGWHRRVGFGRALSLAGLPVTERSTVPQNDLAAVHRLLRSAPAPDGFLCDGEVSALAIMGALRDGGMRVGRDVHLTTLETSAMPALFSPPIPGFYQDLHRAGWMCAELLRRRMGGAAPAGLGVLETVILRDRPEGNTWKGDA